MSAVQKIGKVSRLYKACRIHEKLLVSNVHWKAEESDFCGSEG